MSQERQQQPKAPPDNSPRKAVKTGTDKTPKVDTVKLITIHQNLENPKSLTFRRKSRAITVLRLAPGYKTGDDEDISD